MKRHQVGTFIVVTSDNDANPSFQPLMVSMSLHCYQMFNIIKPLSNCYQTNAVMFCLCHLLASHRPFWFFYASKDGSTWLPTLNFPRFDCIGKTLKVATVNHSLINLLELRIPHRHKNPDHTRLCLVYLITSRTKYIMWPSQIQATAWKWFSPSPYFYLLIISGNNISGDESAICHRQHSSSLQNIVSRYFSGQKDR